MKTRRYNRVKAIVNWFHLTHLSAAKASFTIPLVSGFHGYASGAESAKTPTKFISERFLSNALKRMLEQRSFNPKAYDDFASKQVQNLPNRKTRQDRLKRYRTTASQGTAK